MNTPSRRSNSSHRKGFSLMEILIVIALIAGIVGLVVANLEVILGSNKEKIAEVFVAESIKTPLMAYKINLGNYPTTEEGINALATAPPEKAARWRGPYIEKIPVDPWGNPYHYRYPGTRNTSSYDIWSNGPNGIEGDQDDIGNW